MKHSINTTNLQHSHSHSHGPLTPPEDVLTSPLPTINEPQKPRKSSVTFDPALQFKNEEILSPTATESPQPMAIDLNAHAVPSSILVSLWDRENEMRDLVKHNHMFFDPLRTHLPNWSRFENTLYCPRSQLNDEAWMSRIGKALEANPSLLDRFKDLVGYIGNEPDDINGNQLNDDDEESIDAPEFDNVDLVNIRNFPNRLKKFPDSYPQFFINCQQALDSNGPANAYEHFKETLFCPRSQMTDDMWESSLNDQLKVAPILMTQLKEIIAYEAEEEEEEEEEAEEEKEKKGRGVESELQEDV